MQFTSMKTAKTLKALILLQRCSTYPYIQNTLVRLLLLQVRQLCKVQEELVTLSETRWTCWNSVGLIKPLLPRKQIAFRYGFSVLHIEVKPPVPFQLLKITEFGSRHFMPFTGTVIGIFCVVIGIFCSRLKYAYRENVFYY